MTGRKSELTAASDCVYGAQHLPPRLYVGPLGTKGASVDWINRGADQGAWKARHGVPYHGWAGRCRICGARALMADCKGRPCHKACVEQQMLGEAK